MLEKILGPGFDSSLTRVLSIGMTALRVVGLIRKMGEDGKLDSRELFKILVIASEVLQDNGVDLPGELEDAILHQDIETFKSQLIALVDKIEISV